MPGRPHRIHITTLALIGAALAVVGCGSTHSSSSPTSSSGTPSATSTAPSPASSAPVCPNGEAACVTTSPSAQLRGSKVLTVNVTQAMKVSNPTLRQVTLACPQPAGYPIRCRLTAVETGRGRHGPVTGRVDVLGIYTGTHTYAYSVLYGPAKR